MSVGRRKETEAGKSRKAFSQVGDGSALPPVLLIKAKILKKVHTRYFERKVERRRIQRVLEKIVPVVEFGRRPKSGSLNTAVDLFNAQVTTHLHFDGNSCPLELCFEVALV